MTIIFTLGMIIVSSLENINGEKMAKSSTNKSGAAKSQAKNKTEEIGRAAIKQAAKPKLNAPKAPAKKSGSKKGKKKHGILFAISIVVSIFLVFNLYIAFSIFEFGQKEKPRKSDAIVVLGCKAPGGKVIGLLKKRMDEGIRLYKEGYAKNIIVSGGQGTSETMPEALAMRNYLIDKGVPQWNIFMDKTSASTKENLLNSLEIMKVEKMETALVVSNKFHLRRTAALADDIGMKASYSGVFDSDHKIDEILSFIREIYANIFYGVI